MTMTTFCRQIRNSAIAARALLAASVLLASSLLQASIGMAAQAPNAFNVVVRLNNPAAPPPSDSAFCRSSTGRGYYGATVTVVCATGTVVDISAIGNGMPWKPTHGGAYRFITQFSTASDYQSTINNHGVGTVTSWRTVNLQDRDYLELLIGW
jgi:hypothetical protein